MTRYNKIMGCRGVRGIKHCFRWGHSNSGIDCFPMTARPWVVYSSHIHAQVVNTPSLLFIILTDSDRLFCLWVGLAVGWIVLALRRCVSIHITDCESRLFGVCRLTHGGDRLQHAQVDVRGASLLLGRSRAPLSITVYSSSSSSSAAFARAPRCRHRRFTARETSVPRAPSAIAFSQARLRLSATHSG